MLIKVSGDYNYENDSLHRRFCLKYHPEILSFCSDNDLYEHFLWVLPARRRGIEAM